MTRHTEYNRGGVLMIAVHLSAQQALDAQDSILFLSALTI